MMSTTSSAKNFKPASAPARLPSSKILLERLSGLHPKTIDLSLDRMTRLLAALGNPERRLPPVVHVAGTNGKGSLVAFVRAIAEAQRRRVHTYTSPHLVTFHERIGLAHEDGNAPISEERLIECLSLVESVNGNQPITHFEITTAAAFVAFSQESADLLLLETGLGGRLDATNVVQSPRATVITPISIDHVSFLGDTLASIATEKAGILKPGVPCIVGRQEPEALAVIEAKAAEVGAQLHVFGRDFDVFERDGRLIFQSHTRMINLPLPRLEGAHQIDNAGTAIATASLLFNQKLSLDSLEEGLSTASWPGRLQRLNKEPYQTYLGPNTELLLDGGHNEAGGAVVAAHLDAMKARDPREVHLIWGMMETKDAASVLRHFQGRVSRVYTVPIPGEENAFSASDLAEIAEREGFPVVPTRSLHHALLLSKAAMSEPGRVLIFGSLYLAGHVLRFEHASDLTQGVR
ncbi:folylpolyglutamate synthase/dihydrofolate synthase family protein [Hyphomicrobium sp. ghe19]|uniref:bifunctional folylpolyglutamate synthase/dihydrofolate synthase n=1 Tax=Hyphomicrobium sp. ghe19 TaxID=2682968 RepID=UPI001366F83A|nr:Folylpolyglutamate synthase [Hyphomicrobium sp. ghe19]